MVNNITISYYDEGEKHKPVLIFVHGFPFSKQMWIMQLLALRDDYRVIAYDIRGHGYADMGKVDFSIELFVSDLIGFMDALSIDKATICGLSMGGYIALNAIINHRERFTALILCDTNCIADSQEAKEKRIQTIENIMEKGVAAFANEMIKSLFHADSFATKTNEIETVRSMIVKTSEQSLSKTLVALSMRNETCSRIHEIKVPVLILVGEGDVITPPDAAMKMHEKITSSDLVILPLAGHVSNLENPTEFNHQINVFLSKVLIKSS
jgi:3-oxoadipate enol-lactonase